MREEGFHQFDSKSWFKIQPVSISIFAYLKTSLMIKPAATFSLWESWRCLMATIKISSSLVDLASLRYLRSSFELLLLDYSWSTKSLARMSKRWDFYGNMFLARVRLKAWMYSFISSLRSFLSDLRLFYALTLSLYTGFPKAAFIRVSAYS